MGWREGKEMVLPVRLRAVQPGVLAQLLIEVALLGRPHLCRGPAQGLASLKCTAGTIATCAQAVSFCIVPQTVHTGPRGKRRVQPSHRLPSEWG